MFRLLLFRRNFAFFCEITWLTNLQIQENLFSNSSTRLTLKLCCISWLWNWISFLAQVGTASTFSQFDAFISFFCVIYRIFCQNTCEVVHLHFRWSFINTEVFSTNLSSDFCLKDFQLTQRNEKVISLRFSYSVLPSRMFRDISSLTFVLPFNES